MPSWNEVLNSFAGQPDNDKAAWLHTQQTQALTEVGRLRGGRNVIFYASAFLQKPQAPAQNIQITANVATAHVWAPILGTIGPALLQEAQNALDYGERMVAQWLEKYMFKGNANAATMAAATARHFNDASVHKSHGRRIDRGEARN